MKSLPLKFEAIGTQWEIELYDTQLKNLKVVENKIKDLIMDFDLVYSRFNEKSLVTQMSRKTGKYEFPENAKKLIDIYLSLHRISDGQFTPLIGDALIAAGYDSNYSFKPKTLKNPPEIESVFNYKYPNIFMMKRAMLDFGAAGKGYLIDLVANLLEDEKIKSFIINAGGDILINNFPTKIGLENPLNFKEVIGVININKGSIAASSGSRRKWGNFHHIINPKTLKSPDTILATWVIANDAVTADAIATCLFFTEPEKLLKEFSFQYLILKPDFSIEKSLNFNANIFYDIK